MFALTLNYLINLFLVIRVCKMMICNVNVCNMTIYNVNVCDLTVMLYL